jgi:spore coat protein U-like protein
MNRNMTKLIMAIGAMALTSGAMAASSDADLTVSAGVENRCSIGGGTLEFGDGLGIAASGGILGTQPNVQNAVVIRYVCTNGASASITGGLGLNAVSSVRKLKVGNELLTYELYTTATRDVPLGQTAGAAGSIAATADGTTQTALIHGLILGADIAAAKQGHYADTVVLSINYTP